MSGPRAPAPSFNDSSTSDASAPLFRAFWPKFTVATAKRAPDELRRAVLSVIGATLRSEIRDAHTFGWQDGRVFLELAESIASLGPETAGAFWRYSLRQSISQPVIRTLVDGGIQLFGRTPLALYKRTPRAWSLVSKGCGSLRIDDGADGKSAILRLSDVPSSCRGHDGLVLMLAGAVRGQADFFMQEVQVDVSSSRFASQGEAEFAVRW